MCVLLSIPPHSSHVGCEVQEGNLGSTAEVAIAHPPLHGYQKHDKTDMIKIHNHIVYQEHCSTIITAEGRKEGRKEGRQEGRKAGRQEGRKEHGEEVSDWKFEGGYSQSILKRTLHSKAFEESNYPDSRVLSVFLSGQNRRKCQGLHFSPRVALQPTV